MPLPVDYENAAPVTGALSELPATGPRGINTITGQINTNTTDISAAQLLTVNPQTDSYTLAVSDAGKVVEVNNATAKVVTVPTNASVPLPLYCVVLVRQIGAGQVTVAAAGGVIVNPLPAGTRGQWSTLTLHQRAANNWVVGGDIA